MLKTGTTSPDCQSNGIEQHWNYQMYTDRDLSANLIMAYAEPLSKVINSNPVHLQDVHEKPSSDISGISGVACVAEHKSKLLSITASAKRYKC